MLVIALAMLAIVLIAAVIVVYVAFPHREKTLPGAPWLGEAMRRTRDSLPTQESPEDFYESSPRAPR